MRSLFTLTSILISATTFASTQKTVQIGLASNFSEISNGSSNPYGGYFKGGVTLALEKSQAKLNKAGIVVTTKDFDYGTSDIKVLDAAKQAIASDVVAVMGYNYSSNALLAAPLHQQAKLPMLTPSATATRIGQFGRYIHMGSFDNTFMGETLARTAWTRLKARKAILLPAANCAYCSDLAEAFSKEFQKLGGSIVSNLPILAEDKDFTNVASQIKGVNFDVALIPDEELTSARVIAALTKAGIQKPFMGADGWGNVGQEFFGILGDATFSGYSTSHWHPDLQSPTSKAFVASYRKRFGKLPNDTAVLAYDSTMLLVEALVRAKFLTREGVEDSLNSLQTFNGVTGKFLLSPNKPPKKSLVLLKTGAKKFQIVESIAPQHRGSL